MTIIERLKRLLSGVKPNISDKLPSSTPQPLSSVPTPTIPSRVKRIGSRINDISIMRKVAIAILIIVVLIGGIGGLIAYQTDYVLSGQTSSELKQNSLSEGSKAKLWVKSIKRQTIFLSDSGAAQAQSYSLHEYLTAKMDTLPEEVIAVHVIDTNREKVIGSNVKDAIGKSYKEVNSPKTDFTDLLKNPGTVKRTEPYNATFSDNPTMAFYSGVPESLGNNHRVVMLVVDLKEASSRFNAPSSGRTMITERDGTVILSTNSRHIGESIFELGYADKTLWKKAHAETNPTYRTAQYTKSIVVDDERQVTGITSLDTQEMVAITQDSADSAFYLQQTIFNLLIILLVSSIGTVALVGGAIGLDVVRGLSRLKDTAQTVSSGNYTETESMDRGDELGEVHDSIVGMGQKLQERIREAEQMNKTMEEIVSEQTDVMDEVSDGDLTVRMHTDRDIKQFNELAARFNDMVTNFHTTVSRAADFSDEVSESSEEATAGTKDIRRASDEVASATQEINDGLEQQTQKVESTVNMMEELEATNSQVSEAADELTEQAETTAERSESGMEAAEEASDALDSIEDETEQAVDAMEELMEEMEEISEVVDLISNFAGQTNLLAINAGVEAARAGESGDGFSVVADEVKELAEKVDDAAEDIEESLDTLQNKTERTAEDIQKAKTTVEDSGDTIEGALDALEEINEAVEETTEGVREIDQATEEQATTVSQAVEEVESVAEISEESSSRTESVAAAAEEQTASVKQVTKNIEDLTESANTLNDLLEHFDTDSE